MANELSIDKINIEIESNSSKASKSIDKLVASIKKINAVTEGAASSLKNLNDSVKQITKSFSRMSNVSYSFKKINDETKNLKNNLKDINKSDGNINLGLKGDIMQKLNTIIEGINLMQGRMGEAKKSMEGFFGFSNKLNSVFKTINKTTGTIHKSFSKVTSLMKNAVKFGAKLASTMSKSLGLNSTLKKLSKYLFALFSIRGAYAAINTLATSWLSSSDKAAQQLNVNIDYLKYALGSSISPMINYIANMIYSIAKVIQSVVYSLTGINIFANAFAKNMKKASGSASSVKKELSLAPFDELNSLGKQSGSGSGGGSDLGPTWDLTEVDLTYNKWVEKLKTFFEPLLKSWDKYGGELISQVSTTAGQVATFIGSVWKSFENIITNGTVYTILENILKIIGNISEKFANAWSKDNKGTIIIQNLANAFNKVLEAVDKIVKSDAFQAWLDDCVSRFESMSEKLEQMDWDTLIGAFAQISGTIGTGVLWVLEKLIDLFKWFVDNPGAAKAVAIAIGALVGIKVISGIGQSITDILSGFEGFSKLGKIGKKKDKDTGIGDTTTLDGLSNTVDNLNSKTSALTDKLKTLIKNLAFGIAVIAEVIVAVGLIVLAIWGLGKGLEQVGIAWQPVIDNGTNIAIAMGIGIGVLAAVGAIVGTLGSVGGTQLIINMALGTAILAELGVATGLFIVEIWAIGKGLEQVGIAWQPVLENGDTVLSAIGLGTAMLIAIGAVAGLLGVATTATAGLLPLAIGLGTLMLVELGAATLIFIEEIVAIGDALDKVRKSWSPVLDDGDRVKRAIVTGTGLLVAVGVASAALGTASVATVGLLPLAIELGKKMLDQLEDATIEFIDSLTNVAKQMNEKLQPELRKLNDKLPTLTTDLTNYISLMKTFAGYTVDFTKATAVAGFSNAISTIIGWFTKDPIETFANDVEKTYKQAVKLNEKLQKANPELETAIDLLSTYFNFLEKLDSITGKNSNISLANNISVDMEKVGKNLVTGFVKGIKSEYDGLSNSVKKIFKDTFSSSDAESIGKKFGEKIGEKIKSSMKSKIGTTIKLNSEDGTSLASYSIKAYASGGFPDVGDLFIANENGPEWISSLGGKTAVANQDQMTTGIREAAYQGVSQALRENPQSHKTEVNIGNSRVYEGYGSYQTRQANKYGVSTVTV